MQFLYALPFMFVSAIAFIVCLAMPRLRCYAVSAMLAPLAFGICSVVGLAILMLAIDTQYDSLPRLVAVLAPLTAYMGSGILGTWLALTIMRHMRRHLLSKRTMGTKD